VQIKFPEAYSNKCNLLTLVKILLMKKLVIITLLIMVFVPLYPQVKCVDFKTAKTIDENTEGKPLEYQLYQYKKVPGAYFYVFELYTIGVKHAFDKLYSILECNGLDKNKPAENKNYLDTVVDGITDYKNLAFSCEIGNSEINMVWQTLDGKWKIVISIQKTGAMVAFYPQ
jgi:hypothetical protein